MIVALLVAVPLIAQDKSPAAGAPKTEKEKLSYCLGANLAKNLQGEDLDLDYDAVVRGLKDGITGKLLLTNEEIQSVITAFYNTQIKKRQEAERVQGEKNKVDGAAFLEANKKKDGVVTLPSGLQYKVLTAGTGPKPTATDRVKTQYRGTLIDGTEFDSSYKRGQPAVFPVNGVIKGWTEALQLMPVGSKWQLFVPAELAYGARAVGNVIAPNATLIFEVELVDIEPPGGAKK